MTIYIEKAAAGRQAVSALLAAILFGTAPVAFAQQDATTATSDDEAIEELIVTGYRESLRGARDIKKNSKGIVDAILAEDIGKMPDENVAEALARIPGLAITRDNGEGSQVSIRGIAPNLNRVAINGKTMTSSGDDQAVGFEAFSSGLLDKGAAQDQNAARSEESQTGWYSAERIQREVGQLRSKGFVHLL
jgi:outer membrane receptor for ferrienterochelin and colicin